MGGGEGVDGFGGGEGLLAEGCGFAARCGVEYGDAVGKGGDAGVAAGDGGGGGAADGVGEGGEEQEAAGGEGVAPGAGDAHFGEAAGGADYDGREAGIRMRWLARGPAQQQFEELLFDGGLEAADEGGGVGKWRYSFKCLVLGGLVLLSESGFARFSGFLGWEGRRLLE